VHWINWSWRNDSQWAGARAGRHPFIQKILVSRRDGNFASAQVVPLDAHGTQTLETADIGLIQAAGRWSVLFAGTDLTGICTGASTKALVDLFC